MNRGGKGGRGVRGRVGEREQPTECDEIAVEDHQLSSSAVIGRTMFDTHVSRCWSVSESSLELARQLTEIAHAEIASHEALAKRVVHLEDVLSAARKELAEVRVRNDRLVAQLKEASTASVDDGGRASRPLYSPAAHTRQLTALRGAECAALAMPSSVGDADHTRMKGEQTAQAIEKGRQAEAS